uniref:Uncharacterized protein n=1 Tax=Fallopia multiflora TaxID=76025 RepID=A0A023W109_9CARY|nr:hypothetical protein [Fallopia multiflora]
MFTFWLSLNLVEEYFVLYYVLIHWKLGSQFGAFSFILEGLNKRQQTALALSYPLLESGRGHQDAVSSLAFPLPADLKTSFSSFRLSLKKPKKYKVSL